MAQNAQNAQDAHDAPDPRDGLDPGARAIVDLMTAAFPPIGPGFDAAEARAFMAAVPRPPVVPTPVAQVLDRTIPGPGGELRVRIHRPVDVEGAPPVVVYSHGGGWVLCDLDSHDETVRRLANASGAIVVSVDYRRAPETRFPGPAEDVYAAYTWTRAHAADLGVGIAGDPERVAVAGDSAGGNLAAAVCLMARDRGVVQPTFQLLVYPVTDHTRALPSYRENAEGYFLTAVHMDWFWEQYIGPDGDAAHPYASPLHADDLAGLAPAHVVAAALDPLRDEGVAYARRLADAGCRRPTAGTPACSTARSGWAR
ncbi:alpha/beta hydrolase [Embleya sp. NBC_00896]|uniref:alpha/beta hydrolase n=1 Tax=Embleya sp. NBC_00896 TaxID=2975961 RepID=UPI00386D08EE|nr:alpha/beta hydrolase [Embleya sp. NBC_00896]